MVNQACKPPSGNVGGAGKTLSMEGGATASLELFPLSRDASAFMSKAECALSGVVVMMQKRKKDAGEAHGSVVWTVL